MIIDTIIEKDCRYGTIYTNLFMVYIFFIQKLKIQFWKYKYKLENH